MLAHLRPSLAGLGPKLRFQSNCSTTVVQILDNTGARRVRRATFRKLWRATFAQLSGNFIILVITGLGRAATSQVDVGRVWPKFGPDWPMSDQPLPDVAHIEPTSAKLGQHRAELPPASHGRAAPSHRTPMTRRRCDRAESRSFVHRGVVCGGLCGDVAPRGHDRGQVALICVWRICVACDGLSWTRRAHLRAAHMGCR